MAIRLADLYPAEVTEVGRWLGRSKVAHDSACCLEPQAQPSAAEPIECGDPEQILERPLRPLEVKAGRVQCAEPKACQLRDRAEAKRIRSPVGESAMYCGTPSEAIVGIPKRTA